MKKLLFNTDGSLTGRYDSEITPIIPEQAIEVSDELFFRTISENDGVWKLVNGEVVKEPLSTSAPVESFESKVKRYEKAVEDHLNAGAQSEGFDNIDRARIPAGYPNPKQAISITFGEWHTAVWEYCKQTLAQVQAGSPIPDLQDFITSLPARQPPA